MAEYRAQPGAHIVLVLVLIVTMAGYSKYTVPVPAGGGQNDMLWAFCWYTMIGLIPGEEIVARQSRWNVSRSAIVRGDKRPVLVSIAVPALLPAQNHTPSRRRQSGAIEDS